MNNDPVNLPVISVLMPVLNPHPEFFPKAVQSILNQTHKHFELLIVEDPSPTHVEALLGKFDDVRIRHIKNGERTSLVRQLNQGLQEAKNDLVARMDADDVAHPERLEKQLRWLVDHPEIDVLGSQMNVMDTADAPVGCRRYPLDHDAILKTMPIYNPLAHPAVIYRRSQVLAVGGYQEAGHPEDYDLWSLLAKHGAHFANYPEPLLDYRIHLGAFKKERLRETLRGTVNLKKKYWLNDMGFRGRLRLLGEQALLLLPPRMVLWLFMKLYYQKK